MRILVVITGFKRFEVAVSDVDVLHVADVLERSDSVINYYVDGISVADQQRCFGCGGYTKWYISKG